MKILKTSALAAVLALGSFSANAGTYSATDTLTVTITTAAALTIALKDEAGNAITANAITFDDLIAGDTISATLSVDIAGDSTYGDTIESRTMSCTFGGATVPAATVTGSGVDFPVTGGGDTITTVTLSMASQCTSALNQTITLVSNAALSDLANDGTYATELITMTATYDTVSAIAQYS
jgi:hypothetical protein